MVVVANPDSAKKQVDEFRPKIKAPPLIRLPKHDQSKALHTATRTDTQLSFLFFSVLWLGAEGGPLSLLFPIRWCRVPFICPLFLVFATVISFFLSSLPSFPLQLYKKHSNACVRE